MTVTELIELLKAFPPESIVGLSSMGHYYDSKNHADSHGKMYFMTTKAYGDPRVVICGDAGCMRGRIND